MAFMQSKIYAQYMRLFFFYGLDPSEDLKIELFKYWSGTIVLTVGDAL